MPRNSDTFWSRVLFKDFIRHFRKMTPEQVAEDIAASMDALDDLNPDGDSFGSLMVRWANERMNGAFATAARENGKKGGRPRKETTADGDIREDSQDLHDGSNAAMTESPTSANNSEAMESQGRTGADSLRSDCHSAPVRLPSFDEFTAFIDAQGLDYTDAREWWEMTMVDRDGKDRDGKPIRNWKITCRRFCEAKAKNRRSA